MLILHFYTLCVYLSLQTSATCFLPDGNADTTGTQVPCKSNGQSMCCRSNSALKDPDVCTSDGLCIPPNNGALFRDTCTDRTWQDPACLQLCFGGLDETTGIPQNSTWTPISTCADGRLCCGLLNQTQAAECCNNREGPYIIDGTVVTSKPVSVSGPSKSSSATTGASSHTDSANIASLLMTTSAPQLTVTASPIASPTSQPSSLDTGAIVGGVIGGIAGIVVLALGFWYFMRKKSLRSQTLPQPQWLGSYQNQNPSQMGEQTDYQEVPADHPYGSAFRPGELGSTPTRALEIDSR